MQAALAHDDNYHSRVQKAFELSSLSMVDFPAEEKEK